MNNIIIGCSVIRKEIEAFFKPSKAYVFEWLEDHLHNTPELLHQQVQDAIDRHPEADRIYLLYGHCGQALCGVQARHCPVILPKTEDCIEMLLSETEGAEAMRNSSYFVSQGWLWGEENLGYEYDRMKEKYGEKRAMRVLKAMYHNYKNLVYINTGIETDQVREDCQKVADRLELELKEVKGSVALLLTMLSGTHDPARFLEIMPGACITEEMFRKEH